MTCGYICKLLQNLHETAYTQHDYIKQYLILKSKLHFQELCVLKTEKICFTNWKSKINDFLLVSNYLTKNINKRIFNLH